MIQSYGLVRFSDDSICFDTLEIDQIYLTCVLF